MRHIDVHFASGQDFLSEYKFFLGALAVPTPEKAVSLKIGQRVKLRCRFGSDRSAYEWPGLVLDTAIQTAIDVPGLVIKFDPERLEEVEQIVWSYTRGSAARRETRLDLLVAVPFLAEHRGGADLRPVSALDISRNGCQLIDQSAPDSPFLANHSVKLLWHNGEATGRVCWCEGTKFGVVFDKPLAEIGTLVRFDAA